MSKRNQRGVWALRCVLLVVMCGMAQAQDAATSAIRGTVEDPAGARLPQARVTLTDTQHGAIRNTLTDDAGVFVFSLLAPGEYRMEINADGMAPLRRDAIRIEVGDVVGMTLRMRLAAAA